MTSFRYTAARAGGGTEKGVISADDYNGFIAALKERGLFLIKYREILQNGKSLDLTANSKLPIKEITVFCRQVASLLKVGVSLIKSLDILYQQASNKKMKESIRKLYESVQKGNQFSDSLRQQQNKYPQMMISLVESGESSGTLDSSMDKLATQFEADLRLKNKVRSAMIYPAAIGFLGVAVVILMVTFVLPQFTGMFAESGVTTLPAPTRILMGFADLLTGYWYLIIFGVLVIVIGFRAYIKSEKGNLAWNRLKFKLPVVGKFMSRLTVVRFCRTFATLFSSGMTMLQCLAIVTKVVNNSAVAYELNETSEDIRKGFSLAQAIRRVTYFPIMIQTMISIGEESGSLDKMLENSSVYFNDELENSIAKLISMIEPVMIILMGGMVGFIIISIMLPMVQIYNTI